MLEEGHELLRVARLVVLKRGRVDRSPVIGRDERAVDTAIEGLVFAGRQPRSQIAEPAARADDSALVVAVAVDARDLDRP
jgi:hypothetical protein